MSTTAAYRGGGPRERSARTRARILAAVRGLLEEGAFHRSTVDDVAARAGVARATLYSHFRSRLELVEATCDELDTGAGFGMVRAAVELPDTDTALTEALAALRRFWLSDRALLQQLYGIAAIDPAARELVDRQRGARSELMARLVDRLIEAERLRPGLDRTRALALLMALTSYETYTELGRAGLSEKAIDRLAKKSAKRLLLARGE